MTTPYEPLAVEEGAYPPSKWAARRRVDRRNVGLAVLSAAAVVGILHYAVLGAFPTSSYSTLYLSIPVEILGSARNTSYFRDAYPIRNMLHFLDLAETEIASLGLDTCGDKLGRSLIEAYHRTSLVYAAPNSAGGSNITCAQVKHDDFSQWWPVPASPCVSTNLRAHERSYSLYNAQTTAQGMKLDEEMRSEGFVGNHMVEWEGECEENIKRTLLVVPRQDAWNPFHVAEDMITTIVSPLIAAKARPELAEQPIQMVFNDDFGLEANHYVSMWDKIGAWPPRRLSLDPWNHACLGTVIHSVTAGMSLLSAQGVSESHNCASSLTWAASHYYRHLFNLTPPSKAINVLWLSRHKFDRWAMQENKWSLWRDARHILNEDELVRRLQKGLAGMCRGCYVDENETPSHWAESAPSIRFASLDPSVHSIDTQVHMVGHASILISLHGGALGLSMFLPPGEAVVIELTVPETAGSKHFETMSAQLGLKYESMLTEKEVDVEELWRKVEKWVTRLRS